MKKLKIILKKEPIKIVRYITHEINSNLMKLVLADL